MKNAKHRAPAHSTFEIRVFEGNLEGRLGTTPFADIGTVIRSANFDETNEKEITVEGQLLFVRKSKLEPYGTAYAIRGDKPLLVGGREKKGKLILLAMLLSSGWVIFTREREQYSRKRKKKVAAELPPPITVTPAPKQPLREPVERKQPRTEAPKPAKKRKWTPVTQDAVESETGLKGGLGNEIRWAAPVAAATT